MSDVLTEQERRLYDEKLARGYIRNNIHTNIDIPAIVINLCIKFYHIEIDQFDEDNIGVCHELDGDIITHSGNHGYWSTSLLQNTASDGKYSWKFRVLNCGAVMIGIWKTECSMPEWAQFFPNHDKGYGYMVSHARIYEIDDDYGIECRDNDIITMCLDLDERTLRYYVNDKDQGIAFEGIEKTEYNAAVYTFFKYSSVQLIEYTTMS